MPFAKFYIYTIEYYMYVSIYIYIVTHSCGLGIQKSQPIPIRPGDPRAAGTFWLLLGVQGTSLVDGPDILWQSVTGWWFQPLWKILLGWDDYSLYMGNKNVPNHQPGDIKTMEILKIPWHRICFTFYKQRCKVRGNTTNNHRVITQYCRAWHQSMNPQKSIF